MNADVEHHPDALATLLRDADAAAHPPPVRDNLAESVRLTSRRRHNRRVVATGCALVLVVASAVAVLQIPRRPAGDPRIAQRPSLPVPAVPRGESVAEFQRAKDEAAALSTTANRLLAAERHRQRAGELATLAQERTPTQADRVAALRGAAAMTLIGQGDRFNTRAHSPLDALASYRRALELFPDTPWVGLARRRIDELQSHMRNQEIPS